MALSIDDLFTALSQGDVMSGILTIAQAVGLNTTAWQPGQPVRTVLVIVSQKISDAMSVVATMNKGRFLEYASAVTPEGGPGWLDILSRSDFDTEREPATYAATSVTFTCVGAAGGSFAPGEMHVAAGSNTYHNTATFVLPATGVVSVNCESDVAGAVGTAGVGSINQLVNSLVGVTCTNASAAIGTDSERNAALVSRCRSKFASTSVTGPSGAYDFAARTINGPNQVQVVSGALTAPGNPVTRSRPVTNPATGSVTTYVASAVGAYATPPNHTGTTAKNIVSSTFATPIVLTVGAGHGFVTSDTIFVSGHLVNTNANGTWTVTVAGNNITLVSSVGNGVGVATGTAFQQSDLDIIDKSIQANAVPDGITGTTLTAIANNVAVVGTIVVTGATANLTDAQIQSLISTALTTYGSIIPIGGVGSTLYLEAIKNAAFNAVPASDRVNMTLSSPASDTVLAAYDVVQFSPTPVFVVTRV